MSGTGRDVIRSLQKGVEALGGRATWGQIVAARGGLCTDEAVLVAANDRAPMVLECVNRVPPRPKPHAIMSRHLDGTFAQGRLVAVKDSEEEARNEAERLQLDTQALRYGVFALVGEAIPIKAVSFAKVH